MVLTAHFQLSQDNTCSNIRRQLFSKYFQVMFERKKSKNSPSSSFVDNYQYSWFLNKKYNSNKPGPKPAKISEAVETKVVWFALQQRCRILTIVSVATDIEKKNLYHRTSFLSLQQKNIAYFTSDKIASTQQIVTRPWGITSVNSRYMKT